MVALDLPSLEIFPTALAALVLWPLATAETPERSVLWPAVALIGVSFMIAAVLRLTSPWTPRHPNNAEPIFVIDPAARQAWRASLIPVDPWTLRLLAAEGGAVGPRNFAFSPDALPSAPATYRGVDAPSVQAVDEPGGKVTITATPHPGAARLILRLRSTTGLDGVSVNGLPALEHRRGYAPKPFALSAGQWGGVTWTAPDRVILTLHTSGQAHMQVIATEVYDRWMSAIPLPPTPPLDQMWNQAGSTYVVGRIEVKGVKMSPMAGFRPNSRQGESMLAGRRSKHSSIDRGERISTISPTPEPR
jgi:hypothetical protein